jgi:hypothetical protein
VENKFQKHTTESTYTNFNYRALKPLLSFELRGKYVTRLACQGLLSVVVQYEVPRDWCNQILDDVGYLNVE